MKRVFLTFSLILTLGCARTDYRFERIDGDQPVALTLKFDGLYGMRDGAVVNASGHFADGNDKVTLNIDLYLRPPAEFRSGTFEGFIGGRTTSGSVECLSLTFQGGQTALPTVGGVYVLKDQRNTPVYRVRIPATTLTARKLKL